MITLLSRWFIKDYKNIHLPSVRQGYGMLCGGVGIFFNFLLFAGKFLAGWLSGSIAITADAINNLSDAASSVITLIGFRMAGQKPDKDHPFGHGRIEYVSGLLVSIFILLMAFELFKSSVGKIINPTDVSCSPLIVCILLASIAVKFYMAFYNNVISKKIDSAAMKATATDSLSDTVATTLVLISTLVAYLWGVKIDGYCGVVVALAIFYAGFQATKETISPLLGQPPAPEFVEQIEELVLSHEGIIGVHDLIVHDYGPGRRMISLHAEIPADSDILTMHDLIDIIEHQLRNDLQCDAVIHMDPVCTNDEETIRMKGIVKGIVADIDSKLSLHDFRIVKGPTHTNVIFDLVIPYKFEYSDAETVEMIQKKVQEYDETYFTVIDVDRNYS